MELIGIPSAHLSKNTLLLSLSIAVEYISSCICAEQKQQLTFKLDRFWSRRKITMRDIFILALLNFGKTRFGKSYGLFHCCSLWRCAGKFETSLVQKLLMKSTIGIFLKITWQSSKSNVVYLVLTHGFFQWNWAKS